MKNSINGLHHVTAIAGNAKRNYKFYAGTLGLRLVKKTVNFDDPNTYHLYYGNESGTPGTILTFFPWENMQKGRSGANQITAVGLTIPKESFDFWEDHLLRSKVLFAEPTERFSVPYISFEDPDGLLLELYAASGDDTRSGWPAGGIDIEFAIKGVYSITISTHKIEPIAKVLTDILGYSPAGEENNTFRFKNQEAHGEASIVDLIIAGGRDQSLNGRLGSGSVHHAAFRVANDQIMMEYREKVLASGLSITEKIDRNYFYSVYFREPGGVLFEIASDNPGFTVDEPLNELGTKLKLPAMYENNRNSIVESLPPL